MVAEEDLASEAFDVGEEFCFADATESESVGALTAFEVALPGGADFAGG